MTDQEVNSITPRRIPQGYLALTAEEVQCQAAASSTTAKLIDVEYRLTSCSAMQENSDDPCVVHKTRTQLDILAMRAARERNQAAGEALKFYYQLASAHAGQDAVVESLRLVDRSLSDVRSLKAEQMPVSTSEEELLARRSKLLAKQAELDKSIAQLSGLVVTLTGRGLHPHAPVWPVVPMDLHYEPVDVEAAVGQGLQQRRDLAITRCMLRSLNTNSLPNARAIPERRGLWRGQSCFTRVCWLLSSEAGLLAGNQYAALSVADCASGPDTRSGGRNQSIFAGV